MNGCIEQCIQVVKEKKSNSHHHNVHSADIPILMLQHSNINGTKQIYIKQNTSQTTT